MANYKINEIIDPEIGKAAAVGAVTFGVPIATYLTQMIKKKRMEKTKAPEQKPVKEDAPAMSVGSGVIAGLEPDLPPVRKTTLMRRKKQRLKEAVFEKLKETVYNENSN